MHLTLFYGRCNGSIVPICNTNLLRVPSSIKFYFTLLAQADEQINMNLTHLVTLTKQQLRTQYNTVRTYTKSELCILKMFDNNCKNQYDILIDPGHWKFRPNYIIIHKFTYERLKYWHLGNVRQQPIWNIKAEEGKEKKEVNEIKG